MRTIAGIDVDRRLWRDLLRPLCVVPAFRSSASSSDTDADAGAADDGDYKLEGGVPVLAHRAAHETETGCCRCVFFGPSFLLCFPRGPRSCCFGVL